MCIRNKNVNESKHRPNGASENSHRQYHIPLKYVILPPTNSNIKAWDMFQINSGNNKINIYIMVLFFPTDDIYMSEIEDKETIQKHTCKIKLQVH